MAPICNISKAVVYAASNQVPTVGFVFFFLETSPYVSVLALSGLTKQQHI